MSTERIYPSLEEITEDELNHKITEANHADRIRFMKEKRKQLQEKLKHYTKLKKRWVMVKNISECAGVGLTVICGVLAVVSTTGVLGIPLLLILTTSSGTLASLITTITNKTFIQKHRNSLKRKHAQTKEIYDKLFLYFQKCVEDNFITQQEIEQFEKLCNQTAHAPCIHATRRQQGSNKVPQLSQDFLEQLSSLITKQLQM